MNFVVHKQAGMCLSTVLKMFNYKGQHPLKHNKLLQFAVKFVGVCTPEKGNVCIIDSKCTSNDLFVITQ
jgi:hypothetical protein